MQVNMYTHISVHHSLALKPSTDYLRNKCRKSASLQMEKYKKKGLVAENLNDSGTPLLMALIEKMAVPAA